MSAGAFTTRKRRQTASILRQRGDLYDHPRGNIAEFMFQCRYLRYNWCVKITHLCGSVNRMQPTSLTAKCDNFELKCSQCFWRPGSARTRWASWSASHTLPAPKREETRRKGRGGEGETKTKEMEKKMEEGNGKYKGMCLHQLMGITAPECPVCHIVQSVSVHGCISHIALHAVHTISGMPSTRHIRAFSNLCVTYLWTFMLLPFMHDAWHNIKATGNSWNCYVLNFGRELLGIHEIPAGIPGNL